MVEGKVLYGPQVNKNITVILVKKQKYKFILFQHHIELPQTIPINNKNVALLIFHALKILCIKLSKANLLPNLTPLPSSPSNTHIEVRPRPSWDFQFTLDESFILTLEEQ